MYKSINKMEKFNEDLDSELLLNDFAYYDDWRYGPQSGWSNAFESYILKLMRHSYGYWLIVGQSVSGSHPTINIGSSNDAKEIIAVRDAIQKLW